jgi:hypothetical protein
MNLAADGIQVVIEQRRFGIGFLVPPWAVGHVALIIVSHKS